MKKIMLAVCLMFGGATLVNAQQSDQTATQSQSQSMQDQDRQQISVSELPEEVSSKLESQDYAAWTVGNVYKSTDESQNEIYIVEMRQGAETKKVKFDKDGNKLDKDDKHKDKSSQQYRDQSQDDATEQDATDQSDNTEFQQEQQ